MKYFAIFAAAMFIFPALVSTDEPNLTDIINAVSTMESTMQDISVEYEWRVVPPWSKEEAEAEMNMPMLQIKDGIRKVKLSISGFEIKTGKKRPFIEGPKRWFIEEASIISDQAENWNNLTLESFNGVFYKKLNIDDRANNFDGIIVTDLNNYHPSLILSPIGFSVLRTGLSDVTDHTPLSVMLKEKNLVRLQKDKKNINGFDTVAVDFLQEYTKQVVMRIYFSVNHGFTPVRFEYINGYGTPKEQITRFDVNSLEQVADNLWFPSSGTISSSDDERINVYQATGKILVNQGLKDEDFDIEFPAGTRVYDKIRNKEYVVK
ncbi:MAG: hypothetical protein WC374_03155 [Phycisphaerae bacterium]|jgi:hypothetical protein